ncbi:MAG: VOC family protein [Gammaproteobacteria bacterium]|nr:VOC family protein [Gammaproteobacteria bacterium]
MTEAFPNMVKRTTLLVRDMAVSRRWYEYVLGMQVWMDTEFVLSGAGLAAGSAGDRTHLVIMRGEHDRLGMIGLLQWLEPPRSAPPPPTEVGYGMPVFVVESADAALVAQRAEELGTRVHCPPRVWSTRGARGELRHFIGVSVFDPDGHFFECNQVTAIDEPEDSP